VLTFRIAHIHSHVCSISTESLYYQMRSKTTFTVFSFSLLPWGLKGSKHKKCTTISHSLLSQYEIRLKPPRNSLRNVELEWTKRYYVDDDGDDDDDRRVDDRIFLTDRVKWVCRGKKGGKGRIYDKKTKILLYDDTCLDFFIYVFFPSFYWTKDITSMRLVHPSSFKP